MQMDKPYEELEKRISKLEIDIFALDRALRRLQERQNEVEKQTGVKK
jgi:exonuclease VII small subunit